MKEVRLLEAEIVGYQNELRTNIQLTQMIEYKTIGNEHMQDFYDDWELKFKQNEDQYKEMLKQKRGSRGGKSRHNDGDKYGHREFDKENVKLYNADIPDKSKRHLTTEKEEGKKNKDFQPKDGVRGLELLDQVLQNEQNSRKRSRGGKNSRKRRESKELYNQLDDRNQKQKIWNA